GDGERPAERNSCSPEMGREKLGEESEFDGGGPKKEQRHGGESQHALPVRIRPPDEEREQDAAGEGPDDGRGPTGHPEFSRPGGQQIADHTNQIAETYEPCSACDIESP